MKDFIRRGETEALIEITLASGEAKPIVISRRIKTAKDSGGTSDWKLNGAGCSQVGTFMYVLSRVTCYVPKMQASLLS